MGVANRKYGQAVSLQESYTAVDTNPIWTNTSKAPLSLQQAVELMDTNGYTNWAYGLSGALTYIRMRTAEEQDRPLYVVFLSDGEANQDGGGSGWNIKAEPEVNQVSGGDYRS